VPITVIVRSTGRPDARLTFDGMQPIVIGRGASCDVRLPDATVSHRHACLRAQGADVVLLDEGSTNGTFVGKERIASHTSRIVRSGDTVRVGRIWLELRLDQSPVTRDVAAATREIALELLSRAIAARGGDLTSRVRVVEGLEQGSCLALADEGHPYLVGRGESCDLALSDSDASREHVRIERHGKIVVVCDLGTKNGTWLGGTRAPDHDEIAWRSTQVMRIGRTILTLEEPLGDALGQVEGAPDEALLGETADRDLLGRPAEASAPIAEAADKDRAPAQRRRPVVSVTDVAVIGAAVGVLALSIAGLVWLLRG
jgi:pSer/pThr/pTyr-binding forkhead associated (FHA) protein